MTEVQIFAGVIGCPSTPRARLHAFEALLLHAPASTRAERLITELLLTEALRRLQGALGLPPLRAGVPLSLGALRREVCAIRASRGSGRTHKVALFHQVLRARRRDPDLSAFDVAQALDMSTFSLSRMINRDTGHDFRWHLRHARLEEARGLLLTTMSINNIATTCGFSTASEFSHQFKSEFGVTPSAYRQSHRGGA